MHAALLCVVPDGTLPTDGTLPRVAMPAVVQWPVGDSGTIALTFQGENGEPYDLAGKTVTLACREHLTDWTPLFSCTATVDPTPGGGAAPGTATVNVLGADTDRTEAGILYWFDVRLAAAGGVSLHALPLSKWIPTGTVARNG